MNWIKLHTGIHRNPKVVRAGRDARDVFVLLLCINGEHEFDGVIPGTYAAPEYLARDLGMDAVTVGNALVTACNAGLLHVSETGETHITGYQDQWTPDQSPSRDRVRAFRERSKAINGLPTPVTHVTPLPLHVTLPVTRNAPRGEERRVDREASESAGILTNPETTKKAKPVKSTPLAKWREQADRLWALQETLRAKSLPGSRGLTANDERLARIADRLEAGASEADCAHVLHVYAADAKNPDQAQWFNGETHWRQENFERALGRSLAAMRQVTRGVIPTELMDDS